MYLFTEVIFYSGKRKSLPTNGYRPDAIFNETKIISIEKLCVKNFINPDLGFSPLALYDMWENEITTGNPRNSLYLRSDEIE